MERKKPTAPVYRRWYDKNERLAKLINDLPSVHPLHEFDIVNGLLDTIRAADPELLQKFVVPDEVEGWDRRWYDRDPTYWLVFNCLKNANEALLDTVADYLTERAASVTSGRKSGAKKKRS